MNNNNNNDEDNNSTYICDDNVTQQLTEVKLSNNRLLMSTSVVGRETINEQCFCLFQLGPDWVDKRRIESRLSHRQVVLSTLDMAPVSKHV